MFEDMKEAERIEEMCHYSFVWILYDEVNRSGMLLELLKMIPLESLSSEFLKQVAYHYELIRKDNECLKLLFDALITASKSDVREERRQKIDNQYATNILYAIGGWDGDKLSSISEYNSATHKWTATTPMPSERIYFGCAVIGHKIFVCGGHDGERVMNELTVFDTLTQRWFQLREMKHARELCAAATFNGQIYVAGGRNNTGRVAVMERYNVQTDKWEDVAPLTAKRDGLELVALNGFLYAIGGYDGIYALNIVERYDPETDQWTRMNNTFNSYQEFGSAVLNDSIYIVGKNKCEVYSPADNKWTEMPAPSKSNYGQRLAAYNGKLYAIGGLVGELKKMKGIDTVEAFDMLEYVWRAETNMDAARCFHRVVVLNRLFFVLTNRNMNKFRLQNTGCDVIFEIGDRRFPAHRLVLLPRMKYFCNEFIVHTEKEKQSVIPLEPEIIDSTFFDEVLNYIYTSKITFTTENIRPIYRTAQYLRFDELIYEVEEHLEFTVTIENVCSYLSIAIELSLESLQGVFAQFVFQQILWDINKYSRKQLISTFTMEHLRELLQKLEEDGSIEDMFHYTVEWIAHGEVNRSKMLLELLKNIPLHELSSSFFIEVVSQNSLIRENIECLNLLLNAVTPVSKSHFESRRDVLYAIGGMNEKILSSVSEYNSTTYIWTTIAPMPSQRAGFGCAVIGHKIYVCGGSDRQRNMNQLIVFDTVTRTWTPLAPMKHARQQCGVAALHGHIYVAGGITGRDKTSASAVVERYNVHTDLWSNIAPLTTTRGGPELVALKGFLYAIGGHNGKNVLKSVEQYDPQTGQWTLMKNTNNSYHSFGSVVLNDNIYIAGDKKCEVYNTAFKRWIEMPAPSECKASRRLAVFNGKLYAIGGRVGEWEEWKGSKTVERYDFQARVWKREPDMDVARCYHGIAVVKQ